MVGHVSPLEQVNHRGILPHGLSLLEEKIALKLLRDGIYYVKSKRFYHQTSEEKIFRLKVDVSEIECVWYDIYASCNECEIEKIKSNDKQTLTKDEEQSIFLQFNYSRYRANRILQRHRQRDKWTLSEIRGLVIWYNRSMEIRSSLVIWNLGLVFAIATKMGIFRHPDKKLILTEGEIALIRCVDKFDVGKGFKFSTYAWRGISQSYFRQMKKYQTKADKNKKYNEIKILECLQRMRERPEDPLWSRKIDLRDVLEHNIADLNQNEKTVLLERFFKDQTLQATGKVVKLTKERARQIQIKALEKLRNAINGNIKRNPIKK